MGSIMTRLNERARARECMFWRLEGTVRGEEKNERKYACFQRESDE